MKERVTRDVKLTSFHFYLVMSPLLARDQRRQKRKERMENIHFIYDEEKKKKQSVSVVVIVMVMVTFNEGLE